MKRLIIPDVHENIEAVKLILECEPHDAVTFLGDWVDRFKHQPGDLYKTLQWLLQNVENPKYTFLYGNHDMQYAFHHPSLGCGASFQYLKMYDIQSVFTRESVFSKFRLFQEAEGWLLSHAGFTQESLPLIKNQGQVLNILRAGGMSRYVAAGRARRGTEDKGGVTWLDWDQEFSPLPGVKQIVGHTKWLYPRENTGNWCLDTGLKHYGVLTDGVLQVFCTQLQTTS
jgi:hypothetical protein